MLAILTKKDGNQGPVFSYLLLYTCAKGLFKKWFIKNTVFQLLIK